MPHGRVTLSSSNKGLAMKVTRLAAASLAVLACATIAAPAHAAQPHATDKQTAMVGLIYPIFKANKDSDPKGFKDVCTLYTINSKKVLDIFMAEQGMKDAAKSFGASKKDFRAAMNISIKRVCA